MKYSKHCAFWTILLSSLIGNTSYAQSISTPPGIGDFEFLIGEWEGASERLFPRDGNRESIKEDRRSACEYILSDTYILCDLTMTTRESGRVRNVRLHINYAEYEEAFHAFFFYDRASWKIDYFMKYDAERNAYVGLNNYSLPDGRTGSERIEWRISDDGKVFEWSEFNHLEGDEDGYWPKYYQSTWKKK